MKKAIKATAYPFEPWLDPANWREFAPPKRRGEVIPPPSSTLRVVDREGKVVGHKTIYGVLGYAKKPFLVRLSYGRELAMEGFEAWRETLSRDLEALQKRVDEKGSGYNITPVNASWHRYSHLRGEIHVYVLLTREYTNRLPLKSVGRFGAYLGKLDSRSYQVSSNTAIDGGDPSRSYYRDWDGVFFVREGSLEVTPASRVVQILGVRGPESFLAQGANPHPVVWGVGLIVPDQFWGAVLEGAGIPGSTGDVVAGNRDHIKFSSPSTPFPLDGYTLWVAREAFVTHKATLVQEYRQLHQLSPAALEELGNMRRERIRAVGDAFEALSRGDRQPLIEMVASHLDDLLGRWREGVWDLHFAEEEEEVEVQLQSLQGTQAALLAGAPIDSLKLEELLLSLIRKTQSLTLPGITAFSFPTEAGKDGIILPLGTKVQKGSWVTDLRFPNTGTGMIPLRVEGFSPLPVVLADPRVGKELQAEDYDGDVSVVVFSRLLTADGYLPPVPKGEEVDDLSPKDQIIYGSFSKLAIGLADTALKRAFVEALPQEELTKARATVQTVVDMAKKGVDTTLVSGPFTPPVYNRAEYAAISRFKGEGGYSKMLKVAASKRMTHPEFYGWVRDLPVIEFIKNKSRELDANSLDKQKVFSLLKALSAEEVERAKWLLHVYSLWYACNNSEETQQAGYEYLAQAKQLVLSNPEKWGPALRALVIMNAARICNEHAFFGVMSALGGRPLVPFDKSGVYQLYTPLILSGTKDIYNHVRKVYHPRSFGHITMWPIILGDYDLGSLLGETLGYRHTYPIRVPKLSH